MADTNTEIDPKQTAREDEMHSLARSIIQSWDSNEPIDPGDAVRLAELVLRQFA